jgi:hypothetical protein
LQDNLKTLHRPILIFSRIILQQDEILSINTIMKREKSFDQTKSMRREKKGDIYRKNTNENRNKKQDDEEIGRNRRRKRKESYGGKNERKKK